jgi:hypothetical protein
VAVGSTILGLFLLKVIDYPGVKRLLHRHTLLQLMVRLQPNKLGLIENPPRTRVIRYNIAANLAALTAIFARLAFVKTGFSS